MTREEAISEWTFRSNHIKKWIDEYGEEPSIRHYVELIDMAIEALSAEAVQGGWVIEDAHTEHCSVCGYAFHTSALFAVGGNDEPNFCPNCGAEMRGEEE